MREETCIAPTYEQFEAINKHAQRSLKKLLKNHEAAYGDQEHEWKFIGDLFARLIVASFMGYIPEELGRDAERAGQQISKMAGSEDGGAV
jgi:hypothetical protein